MPDVRVNGLVQMPLPRPGGDRLAPERLRTIVESAHLNFLIGAGTSAPFFEPLGNIEDALNDLADIGPRVACSHLWE